MGPPELARCVSYHLVETAGRAKQLGSGRLESGVGRRLNTFWASRLVPLGVMDCQGPWEAKQRQSVPIGSS